MAANKTSLSVGELIREILLGSVDIVSKVTKIYPVVEDSATLPYIVFRRTALDAQGIKGRRGTDTVSLEVLCYTRGYTEGVELAEEVREALDGIEAASDDGGLVMRSCVLTDCEEAWQADAYIQRLIFNIKV